MSEKIKTSMTNKIYLLGELSGYKGSGKLQDFYSLREEHLKKNSLLKMIFTCFQELCKNPKLFIDGHSRFDAIQGYELGDCWVIAAIANLASHEELLHFVMPTDQSFDDKYAGIFHFRFWQYGKWVDVVIDDRLPYSVHTKRLFSICSEDESEFWSALIEKAYAKLHGSYQALVEGYINDALQDFTGGVTEILRRGNVDPTYLYEFLRKSWENGALMGCSFENKRIHNLRGGHAYSITNVKYVQKKDCSEKIPLLRIRNPWGPAKDGGFEWTGRWNDSSQFWQKVSAKDKQALGYVKGNDGEFWISFEDFEKLFINIEICHRLPFSVIDDPVDQAEREWKVSFFEGSWVKNSSAGGRLCLDCCSPAYYSCNPQYRITLTKPDKGSDKCTLLVGLLQKLRRQQKHLGARDLDIFFDVYRLDTPDGVPTPLNAKFFVENKPVVNYTDHVRRREYTRRITVDPGIYCIVPNTHDKDQEGQFLLRVFAEQNNVLQEYDVVPTYDQYNIHKQVIDVCSKNEVDENERVNQLFLQHAGDTGTINWVKLKLILDSVLRGYKADVNFTSDTCKSLLAMLDVDQSGELSLCEFQALWKDIQHWKSVFSLYDKDDSGTLSPFELRNALNSVGFKFGEKGSGTISKGDVQDFYKLREECLKNNILFEDPNFPADVTSLSYSSNKSPCVWHRPIQVCKNPQMFIDGASRFDVKQGHLNNCWLAASIAGLARYRELLIQVVPEDQEFNEKYAGIFHFRFWQYGKWVDVVIDDRLPFKASIILNENEDNEKGVRTIETKIGDLAYLSSSNENEFWASLLEKAYAKLHGSYEALAKGNSLEAMQDFTGGISEIFHVEGLPSNFFELLLVAQKRCSLMTCCFQDEYSNEGLKGHHAYTVTDLREVQIGTGTPVSLIRIRNPWGSKFEWKGSFSDGDEIWKNMPQFQIDSLDFKNESDGEFWMNFEDFKKVFMAVVVCNLTPESLDAPLNTDKKWKLQTVEGQWVNGITAGGSDSVEKLVKNPQYLLTMEEADVKGHRKCSIILSLLQKRRRAQHLQNLEIGYYVLQVDNISSVPMPLSACCYNTLKCIVDNSSLRESRDLTSTLLLNPGTYCVIPCTRKENQEGEYLLRIYSESGANFKYFDSNIAYNEESIDARIIDIVKGKEKVVEDEAGELFAKYANGKESELYWPSLRDLLHHVANGFTKEVCRSLVAMLDVNRSGSLSLAEFRPLWADIKNWQICFNLHDANKSGKLEGSELRNALNALGFSLHYNVLNVLARRYSDGNGNFTLDDFLLSIIKLKTTIEMPRKYKGLPESRPYKNYISESLEKALSEIRKRKSNPPRSARKGRYLEFGEKGSGTVSNGDLQDFYKLREDCLRKNILFEDPNFPADETSLFYSKDKLTSYKWLRPKEISDNPLLFVDGTSRFDVIQGSLGNCWFAASLAGLARYKQLVYQVVPNDQSFDDNYAGIFHFRFWQYGKWIDIVIDDRLPFKAISPIKSIVESIGDLAFFKSSDQDEFWTALLEKAYAKLHGSYEALERGNSLEAMQDFTGGISEEFVADNIPENFFEILLTAKQRCSLMACCFHEDNENRGLEPAHAYTITDIKLIDIDATNLELIRIRNPWGRKEWTGNFCDQDSIWNKLSQAVKDELKFQDKVDGEFWMEFNDFKNVFTFVVVCNLTPESLSTSSDNPKRWKLQMLEGQWVNGATAGGSKPIESLAKNPQYLVTLEQPDSNGSGKCSVIISLMQRNRRSQRHKGLLNLAIGYDVRRVHNALSISKPLNASSLSTFRSRFRNPPLAPVRDLSCRLLLKPVTYCIIPFTEDPEQEGEYLLRIFSENGVKLEYFDEGISYEDGDIDDKLYSERSL
ncbi:calpain [Holotrichia oblita]|uniref:Calpain n=1 Tax=Holotrichia oblita TaxID=644536 RepID=A0ACB9TT22_HOLOL|nr:calpain [Holotrichia oblita]